MTDLHPPEPGTNGADSGVVAVLPAMHAMAAMAAPSGGVQPPAPPYSKRWHRGPSVCLEDIDALPPRRNHKPFSSLHLRPPLHAHLDDLDPHRQPPVQHRPRTA